MENTVSRTVMAVPILGRITLPVDGVHVTRCGKGDVHRESSAKSLRGMCAASQSHVIAQNGSVVWMSAVFNDGFGPLRRTLATQIGDALLSYDDLDGMLAAVQMADQRNDSAYLSAFGRRGAGENGEKSVASEITVTR